jgi:hypothetical protein
MNEKNETVVEVSIKEDLLDGYVSGYIHHILRQLNRQQLEALKESIDVEMQIKDALDMTS